MTTIRCQRVNHMNLVLEDFDASVAHLAKAYDAEFMLDMAQPEWHACLVETGQVIFELFVPYQWLTNARYGPHHVGLEYQADVDQVRAAIAERGIRITRDIGIAVHTHPADCFGVAFEFYGGYFHDSDWALLGGGKIKSPAYWRDEHPLGLTGLKAYTVAVHDLDAAEKFFRSFLQSETAYEEARPAVAGQAIGLQVADAVVELVTPTGKGALRDYLHRYGDGIRSTVFGVRDIAQARRYFAGRGIATVEGSLPGSLAVPAEANLGVIFEFAE